jgi:hypothetical protein
VKLLQIRRRDLIVELDLVGLTGSFLREKSDWKLEGSGIYDVPTLELASVSELRVVDLPLEGLPTRPINGSRGIVVLRGGGCGEARCRGVKFLARSRVRDTSWWG